jgi:hypothetical protein
VPSSTFFSRQEFNNADSFAQAFDTAWTALFSDQVHQNLSTREKLQAVLEAVQQHPFMVSSPSLAREVGAFRIRLLGL